ncbi:MAG: type VII secretion integral membrane protein EccD [Actinomycetales bacterium]
MPTMLDVCRVTVVTPTRWAVVALPATQPLADLVPALLDHLGEDELAGRPLAVQLPGGPPLDQSRSLSSNGVLDGQTLHVQPGGDDDLPKIDFDDAVSGIAAGVHELPTRWSVTGTRATFLGLAAVPLAVAWVVIAFGSLPGWVAAGAAFALTVLTIVGAGVSSRARGDATLSVLLGLAAVPFAGLGGVLLVGWVSGSTLTSPATWLAASALIVAVAATAQSVSATLNSGFAGISLAAAVVAVTSAGGVLAGWSAAETLAVMLVLACLSVDMVVGLSCRLAGVVLPDLPRTTEELAEFGDTLPAAEVVVRAARVDAYLGGLLCGLAAVAGLAGVSLLFVGQWATVLALVGSVSILLRTRSYESVSQRLALLAGGQVAPVVLVVLLTTEATGSTPLVVLAVLAAAAGLFSALRIVLRGHRVPPRIGRLAEIAEITVAVGLLPLLLAVFDTYSVARNLF